MCPLDKDSKNITNHIFPRVQMYSTQSRILNWANARPLQVRKYDLTPKSRSSFLNCLSPWIKSIDRIPHLFIQRTCTRQYWEPFCQGTRERIKTGAAQTYTIEDEDDLTNKSSKGSRALVNLLGNVFLLTSNDLMTQKLTSRTVMVCEKYILAFRSLLSWLDWTLSVIETKRQRKLTLRWWPAVADESITKTSFSIICSSGRV